MQIVSPAAAFAMEDQSDVKIWNCGYELRFELWETEGNFKNKNFGRLSQRR